MFLRTLRERRAARAWKRRQDEIDRDILRIQVHGAITGAVRGTSYLSPADVDRATQAVMSLPDITGEYGAFPAGFTRDGAR